MNPQEGNVIVVTDADCASALGCIRSLGRAGYQVFAVGSGKAPPASASRYVKHYFQASSPWSDGGLFISQLLQISEQVDADYILPVSEATIFFISKTNFYQKVRAEILVGSEDLRLLGTSKISTFKRALENSSDVVDGFVLEAGNDHSKYPLPDFPVIIRTDNKIDESGRYKKGETWVAKSLWDWKAILREQQSTGQRLLVQKYIEGQGSGCFLLLWKGDVICWHTHRRLAEIPWQGGVSARRCLDFDRDLLLRALGLLEGLNASGLAMIEYRCSFSDSPTGIQKMPFVVEINSRPWGSMALSTHANIPFVPLWIELCKASKAQPDARPQVCRPSPQPKKLICTSIYPGEFQHLWSVFRSVYKSELTAKEGARFFLKSLSAILHPGTHYDYFWREDPMPAVASLINAAARLCKALIMKSKTLIAQGLFAFHKHRRFLSVIFTSRKGMNLTRKVVVVCYGNRCRSPFFEMLLREPLKANGIALSSRGIEVSERSVPLRFHEVFRSYGLDPSLHTASQISSTDVDEADEILVMEWHHVLLLAKRFGWKYIAKFSLLKEAGNTEREVPDPFLLNPVDAALVFSDLHCRAQKYAEPLSHSLQLNSAEELSKTGHPIARQ